MSRYIRNNGQIKSLRFKRLVSRIRNIEADQASWFSLNFIFYFHAQKEKVDKLSQSQL